jgi:mRNA-degrading endonuclease RelE of RelBE toxin-antitoxin system
MHRTTDRFRKNLDKLSAPIKKIARENFHLLKENPRHPSLHFKKVGKFWSVRIGLNHRALAVKNGDDYIWVWIGTHDEYERMIKDI